MPRGRAGDGEPLLDRLKRLVLKPPDPDAPAPEVATPPTAEEARAVNRTLDDRERAIGLIAGPVAGVLAVVISGSLVTDEQKQYQQGKVTLSTLNSTVSEYHVLMVVLLVMAALTVAAAFFHKRLFLGIVVALIGLGLFNLHWWGFGLPFILVGAWFLVRAYRFQRVAKEASADSDQGTTGGSNGSGPSRPRANKRYTPPK